MEAIVREPGIAERRKYPRFKIDLPVRYAVADAAATTETISENISAGGICIITDHPVALRTPLILNLSLPKTDQPVRVHGEVVWTQEIPVDFDSTTQYEAGIEFLALDSGQREQITSSIASR